MKRVTLDRMARLTKSDLLNEVYFSEGCLFSVVINVGGGMTVEVSSIGLEGFTGADVLLGGSTPIGEILVQVGGPALAISRSAFITALEKPGIRAPMAEFIHRQLRVMALSAACFAFHPVEARLARWLLTAQDSVERDDFPLTHGILAVMLGVQRPTATVALSLLTRAGFIERSRNRIVIVDSEGLVGASCGCYVAAK